MSDSEDVDERVIEDVAAELQAADHAAALTGAGVSAPSGIPSFRGEDGIWGDEFDPADFQYARFQAEPGDFWKDRLELHEHMVPDEAEPNAAHEALAELERSGHLDAVVTQNTDGLHAEAGSETVVDLHGNAQRVACQDCGRRLDAGPVRERVRGGEIPPRCECDGLLKPDVVLFGEELPTGALQQARRHARESEVFFALGSSLQVQPAASLPRIARNTGATLVVINLESTPVSGEYDLRADVTAVLPRLVAAL